MLAVGGRRHEAQRTAEQRAEAESPAENEQWERTVRAGEPQSE